MPCSFTECFCGGRIFKKGKQVLTIAATFVGVVSAGSASAAPCVPNSPDGKSYQILGASYAAVSCEIGAQPTTLDVLNTYNRGIFLTVEGDRQAILTRDITTNFSYSDPANIYYPWRSVIAVGNYLNVDHSVLNGASSNVSITTNGQERGLSGLYVLSGGKANLASFSYVVNNAPAAPTNALTEYVGIHAGRLDYNTDSSNQAHLNGLRSEVTLGRANIDITATNETGPRIELRGIRAMQGTPNAGNSTQPQLTGPAGVITVTGDTKIRLNGGKNQMVGVQSLGIGSRITLNNTDIKIKATTGYTEGMQVGGYTSALTPG